MRASPHKTKAEMPSPQPAICSDPVNRGPGGSCVERQATYQHPTT